MIEADAPVSTLIARLEHAAEQARQSENACRKEAAERIAALALLRGTAFRRLNLVRNAARAIVEADDPAKAVPRARLILANTLGWDEPGPRQQMVLDRLMPALEALDAVLKAGSGGGDHETTEDFEAELRGFEAWYRAETGSDFYDLFDLPMPETPRVDF